MHAGGFSLHARVYIAPSQRAKLPPVATKRLALSWARRLKRVFGIEIERCVHCGGTLEIIASIEEPDR